MPTNTRSQWHSIEGQIRKRKTIHFQKQSPLYGKISAEIRNSIFKFALILDKDPKVEFLEWGYQPRPDTRERRTGLALLLTCSIVYLEGHRIAPQSEHTFWVYSIELGRVAHPLLAAAASYGPLLPSYSANIQNYFYNVLSKQQRSDATSVHLHVSKAFLESPAFLARLSGLPAMKHVKHLRLSIGVLGWGIDEPTPEHLMYITRGRHLAYANAKLNHSAKSIDAAANQTVASSSSQDPGPVPINSSLLPIVALPLSLDLRMAGPVNVKRMQAAIDRGEHIPIEKNSFAFNLLNFASLEALTLELDTITTSRKTLECLVNHAKTWVFPRKLKGRGKASAEKEMRVIGATEIREWSPFVLQRSAGETLKWGHMATPFLANWEPTSPHIYYGLADEAITAKLEWVVVRKEVPRS